MRIYDNFLEEWDFKKLEEQLSSPHFPWYYAKDKVFDGDGQGQFYHVFYRDGKPNSDYFPFLDNLITKLDVGAIRRLKANMTTKTLTNVESPYHCDFKDHMDALKTSIYYINTCNGKTYFKDTEELPEELQYKPVDSVANRLVTFDAFTPHMGTTQTDKDYRIVININWY